MIWSSPFGKVAVLIASVGAHGLAGALWWTSPKVEIEGGAPGAVQTRLGNSFADLSAGTLAPKGPDGIETVKPIKTITAVPAKDTVKPAEPKEITRVARPATLKSSEATPVKPLRPAPHGTALSRQIRVVASPAAAAQPIAPSAPTMRHAAPQVITAQPAQPTLAAQVPASDTLQPLRDDNVQVSARPQLRPKRIEQRTEQRRQKSERQSKQRAKPGNSSQTALAGSDSGSSQAKAKRKASKAGQSTSAGNAAANNYPGQVMRKISRVPRPRVGSRGTAVVSFAIAANGGLSRLSIARSSGNARLDQAALRMIQRAAPFPRPPAGARRSYQISIKGKG